MSEPILDPPPLAQWSTPDGDMMDTCGECGATLVRSYKLFSSRWVCPAGHEGLVMRHYADRDRNVMEDS